MVQKCFIGGKYVYIEVNGVVSKVNESIKNKYMFIFNITNEKYKSFGF